MNIETLFNNTVQINKRVYTSKDTSLREYLKERKLKVKQENSTIKPEIDKSHKCLTCGSLSGKCHPVSGYCFICDTDNWHPVNNY